MSTVAVGHTTPNRGVTPIVTGRQYDISAPVDCWISISPIGGGDAVLHDFHFMWLKAGVTYRQFIPVGATPQFLSGLTTDTNGDAVPTTVTFVDQGASGF